MLVKDAARNEQIARLTIKSWDEAIKLDPNFEDAWYNRAIFLSNMSRFEEAVQNSDMALELNPRDAAAWANKARFLMALERYEEAIPAYDNALRLCGQ